MDASVAHPAGTFGIRRAQTTITLVAALHLLPGMAITAVYLAVAPILVAHGIPRIAAVLTGFVLAGIPIQLAVIRALGKSGAPAVVFRARLPRWEYALAIPLLLAAVVAILMLPLGGASTFLRGILAGFPPLLLPEPKGAASATVAVLTAKLVIDGFVNPIVEETYFRGVLLPRLAALGWAAPVVSTLLFTLAHFWQMTNYVTIFAIVLPLTLYTYWRRNFYAQAVVHCAINILGVLAALAG